MARIKNSILMSGVGLVALSAPAIAQTEEIFVTAQRRAESVQDVPISLTAFGSEQLSNENLDSATDLVDYVPNLQAATTIGEGLPIFSLRGISQAADFSVNQQGPIATYFDEVYKGSFPLLPVAMFDLERVEVLRGPQGTLYGKNTTGGAINFVSKTPGYELEAEGSIGYGNYNRIDASGALQAGISDVLAARVAFTYTEADGWFNNLTPGLADPDAINQYGVRVSILFEPADNFDVIFRYSTSLQNPINYGVFTVPGPDGVGAGVYELFGAESYFRDGLGTRDIESNRVAERRHRTHSGSLTANWGITETLTITSVTSYDTGDLFIPEDSDGSPLEVVQYDISGDAEQISQDLRLTSEFSGPFDFILGAYYNVEKIDAGTTISLFTDIDVTGDGTIDADDCLVDFVTSCKYRNDFDQKKTSFALYFDGNYSLTESLTLRGGVRYTMDDGDIDSYTAQLLSADDVVLANIIPGDPTDLNAAATQSFEENELSGKIGVDYKTPGGTLIYASYNRGYRSNAFNAQAFFFPEELSVVEPETVNAYEIGFKSQLLDGLTLNGGAFYYGYRNQQTLNVDPATLVQTLVNIPKSRIFGAELELISRPTDQIKLTAGLGLLDTEIKEGVVSGADLAGNSLTNAPSVNVNASIDWEAFEFDAGTVSVTLNGSYSSKQFFELFNVDRLAQEGFLLLNGRLGFQTSDERFGVSVWARNITNKTYFRSGIDVSGFGFDFRRLGEPRTFGITLDARL